MMPPKGSNRGHYSNAKVDALLAQGAAQTDNAKRRAIYLEVQRILAEDEPTLVLWSPDNIVVHTKRLH
ncbi:MAG: ABC transporter substrate-binding protein, partial [Terriglobus sp.]